MFLLTVSLLSFLADPLTNGASRYIEHRADAYGLRVTHNGPAMARAFVFFARHDLDDPDPPPFIKFWMLHPPAARRAHRLRDGQEIGPRMANRSPTAPRLATAGVAKDYLPRQGRRRRMVPVSTPTTAASGQVPPAAPARIAGTDFRPPRLHLPTLRLFRAALPLLLRRFCDVARVDIPPDDVARLKALAGERLLLTPNHPTNDDPALLFALSQAAGHAVPLPGLPRDVRRPAAACGGGSSSGSARTRSCAARRTGSRSGRRVRCWPRPAARSSSSPRARCTRRTTPCCRSTRASCSSPSGRWKTLRKAGDPAATISLLPVAVRYYFVQDMTAPIAQSLDRLGGGAGPAAPDAAADDRTRACAASASQMLETMEAEYGLKRKAPRANRT